MSNIQKLFSERIEIFGSVEFNKVSVVTGVIKIALKVKEKSRILLHCVVFDSLPSSRSQPFLSFALFLP